MPAFSWRYEIPEDQYYDIGNWHSPYFFLAFFAARRALFESFGASNDKIQKEGYAVIADELGPCKFIIPLRRGDIPIIEITPVLLGRSSMTFLCNVYREGDPEHRTCASGFTKQKLINRATGKTVELPEWIRKQLEVMIPPENPIQQ